MIDEKKLVKLLKRYHEASKVGQQAQTNLFLYLITRFGKSLEEYQKFRKKQPTRHDINVYLDHLCPLISCGDKPMVKKGDKYVCSICRLSFDAKIWDDGIKAILEHRKASNELHEELDTMQEKVPEDLTKRSELEDHLIKKYGKEKWWNTRFIARFLFGQRD